MKEQAPKINPLFLYSAEERKTFREKGISEKEINAMERQKTPCFATAARKQFGVVH